MILTLCNPSFENRRFANGRAVRLAVRSDALSGNTAGLAPGNLVVLPEALASDFLRFAQRNPKPCPLLGVSEPGSRLIPELGLDLDIATDLPAYRVWRDGALADEPASVGRIWRADLVSFVIGCSFTFEEELIAAGLPMRHVSRGHNVSMDRTSIPTQPAGPFQWRLVVSTRPLRPADAIRAVQITSRFPAAHGAPVHIGDPEAIGIADIAKPATCATTRRSGGPIWGFRRQAKRSDDPPPSHVSSRTPLCRNL